MPSATEFSDELVLSFSTTPRITFDMMIRGLPIPKRSRRILTSPTSSMGLLSRLPMEIRVAVLKLLDFQSLSRLSRTSLKAKSFVEAMRWYREVMKYSPNILAALGKTDLLKYHSSVLVRQVLSETKCVSCLQEFGGILFLPTCERICRDCLERNYAYHLTDVAYAEKWFTLTNEQLQSIPIMRSIPGFYKLRTSILHPESHQLVSIKQLRQLAIKVHGSPEKVAELLPPKSSMVVVDEELGIGLSKCGPFELLEEFHKAPLEPPGCDLSRLKFNGLLPDQYPGMASIHIPSITKFGHIEKGHQCRGCRHSMYKYSVGIVLLPIPGYDIPAGMAPMPILKALAVRLRAWPDFRAHVLQCEGVRRLLAGEKEETDEPDDPVQL
ncbi:hypothetical protein BHE90_005897 [Fusarium euwallaceae]|uniref:F-box domain-containing protein n=2 Tax=Fusarium solani species complex TaxID=232080 RepID=A0A3M2S7S7_9HYPO|nr:hypothetical protein CDV36_006735 [Fusarium kuroshium]RTE79651.1 hypothetical protein BHE90_005897 [Fusarium euwallaceae]